MGVWFRDLGVRLILFWLGAGGVRDLVRGFGLGVKGLGIMFGV